MFFLMLLLLLLTPIRLDADELELIKSVRYEDLRSRLEILSPNHDYDDRKVDLWGNLAADCFENLDDLEGAFNAWLNHGDHSGLPGAVELRCKPWRDGSSIVVISEFSTRENPPKRFLIYAASETGSTLRKVLFDDAAAGPMVVDHYSEFLFENGKAVGFVFLEQLPETAGNSEYYPEWASVRVYLFSNSPRRVDLDALAAYRIVGEKSTSLSVLCRESRDMTQTLTLRKVGIDIELVAEADAPPPPGSPGEKEGSRYALLALRPLLTALENVRQVAGVETIFESGELTEYRKELGLTDGDE